ncbi:MAG: hypothetical protein GX614_15000 [Sandaracinaceae bacterium]|nr:hypothetical protein [Sandaracinaceae bacterium]
MNFSEAVDALLQARAILCSCHQRPDADALGSALAIARALKHLAKDASVYIPDPLNPALAFLPHPDEIQRALPTERDFDLVVVTDTAARSLLPEGLPKGVPQLIIDHHLIHDDFGEIVLRDTEAASTGEIVLGLLDRVFDAHLEVRSAAPAAWLTQDIAEPIYAAIVADTGGFRYAGTKPETLRAGARLLEAGVDPARVSEHLFERWPLGRFRLLAALLDRMELLYGGRVAYFEVPRALLEAKGADDDMLDGLINYGRMLDGVQLAILLWEFETGERLDVKLSLRSRAEIDSAALAATLGGGGHRYAAGARVRGTLTEVRARVMSELEEVFR